MDTASNRLPKRVPAVTVRHKIVFAHSPPNPFRISLAQCCARHPQPLPPPGHPSPIPQNLSPPTHRVTLSFLTLSIPSQLPFSPPLPTPPHLLQANSKTLPCFSLSSFPPRPPPLFFLPPSPSPLQHNLSILVISFLLHLPPPTPYSYP